MSKFKKGQEVLCQSPGSGLNMCERYTVDAVNGSMITVVGVSGAFDENRFIATHKGLGAGDEVYALSSRQHNYTKGKKYEIQRVLFNHGEYYFEIINDLHRFDAYDAATFSATPPVEEAVPMSFPAVDMLGAIARGVSPADPGAVQIGGDHYKNAKGVQPIEFINSNNLPYAEGCVIKYVFRHASKNGLQDLQKAKHYIDFIIARDYGESAKQSA